MEQEGVDKLKLLRAPLKAAAQARIPMRIGGTTGEQGHMRAVDEDTAAVSPSSVTSGSEQHLQYETECPIFAMAHTRRHGRHRIAVGSYLLKEENKLQIVEETSDGRLVRTAEADIAYPVTKLMWLGTPDLLASTGHALRLWRYSPDDVSPHGGALGGLKEVATLHSQPPMLTTHGPCISVDTTCTIWNLEKQKIETQLIAHDRAVYDIAFSATIDSLFSSVGADGSVRLFDQKNLDHSTIIYESAEPLLRLAWSEFDTNLIAAVVAKESTGVIVLDIRKPSVALTHAVVPANSIAWVSRTHLLTADNNGMASIFDVSTRAVRPTFAMQDHTQPGVSPSQHHPHGGLPHMQQPLPPPNSFYNLRARTVLEYNLGRPALQASYSYRENAACISTGSSLEIVPLPPFLARDRGELGLGGVVAGVGGGQELAAATPAARAEALALWPVLEAGSSPSSCSSGAFALPSRGRRVHLRSLLKKDAEEVAIPLTTSNAGEASVPKK
eukprot:g9383.t1